MAKIKIDSALFQRAKAAAKVAGYSSLDEFIVHVLEREVAKHEQGDEDKTVADRLRGLGYIE
ncbi:MAG: hypothetical protein HQ515_17995 [Phycisphaeraceae bacterium]|nr:hypothetical protein [Phycisphaeraceae bacterium]